PQGGAGGFDIRRCLTLGGFVIVELLASDGLRGDQLLVALNVETHLGKCRFIVIERGLGLVDRVLIIARVDEEQQLSLAHERPLLVRLLLDVSRDLRFDVCVDEPIQRANPLAEDGHVLLHNHGDLHGRRGRRRRRGFLASGDQQHRRTDNHDAHLHRSTSRDRGFAHCRRRRKHVSRDLGDQQKRAMRGHRVEQHERRAEADNADRSVLCNTCKTALVLAAGFTLNIDIPDQIDLASWEEAGRSWQMDDDPAIAISLLAGKPAPKSILVDLARLESDYYARKPDVADATQLVSFGTSGHRGSSLRGSFTEAHIAAITQAICDYRRTQGIDGPLYMGKDTHALSDPAQRTALEVLAANGVETTIQREGGVAPTPVISWAILVYNRGRTARVADGIVVTPSHNPPEDGGFKYNPPNGGPADVDVTQWIQNRANELLRTGNASVKRVSFTAAINDARTHQQDFVLPYVQDLKNVVDMEVIRDAGLELGVDPRGGASQPYWEPINSLYKIRVAVVNATIDPTFSFMTVDHDGKIRMDPSSPYAMARLVQLKDQFRVAFANDVDADRPRIVNRPPRPRDPKPH